MSSDHNEFPFDFWAKLARNDPAAFETARRLMIDSMIESAPERNRQRLRGLQWQIDRVRERAANPMSACVRLSNMMWEKILGEDGLVDHVLELSEQPTRPRPEREPGRVLPFRRDPA